MRQTCKRAFKSNEEMKANVRNRKTKHEEKVWQNREVPNEEIEFVPKNMSNFHPFKTSMRNVQENLNFSSK